MNKKEGINVFSLFDGCGMAYQALKNLNIKVNKYFSSEIDESAIYVAKKNHPDIISLGDINLIDFSEFKDVDFLIGGSPCQGFSFAGKGLNFKDERSKLFFKYVEAKETINPKYFILENVKMKKEYEQKISDIIGVSPMLINSSLLTAQLRSRLYWFNWEVNIPVNLNILLKDVIDDGFVDRDKSYCIDANYYKGGNLNRYFNKSSRQLVFNSYESFKEAKENLKNNNYFRKLSPTECERLQGLPDNYTLGVSSMQRYKMIGNGFTVKIIEHLLKGMMRGW